MACRSLKKASIAKKKILEIIPDAKITIMELDLFSIESIDNFANQYQYSFLIKFYLPHHHLLQVMK